MPAYPLPIAGFSGLVKVGIANVGQPPLAPGLLNVLGYAKDQTITFNAEPLDVTSYQSNGWMEHIVGLRSWEASIEALYVDGNAGLSILRSASLVVLPNGYPPSIFSWVFAPIAQGIAPEGTNFYTGNGVLASFEIADPVDDVISITFSVTGSGPLLVKQTVANPPTSI